MSSYCSCT
jgi:hypothetical protein